MSKNTKSTGILMKILCFTLIFAIFSVGSVFAAEGAITVKIDGEAVEFDAQPEKVEGEVMVPIRKLFEKAGIQVLWDPFFERVLINPSENDQIQIYMDNGEAIRNGVGMNAGRPAYISQDRTYGSLSLVQQIMGMSVEWSDSANTVFIVPEHKAMQYIPFGEFLRIPSPYSVNRNYELISYENTGSEVVTTLGLNGENQADFERYALIMEAAGFKTVNVADEENNTDIFYGMGMVITLERPDEEGIFNVKMYEDATGESIKDYLEGEN